MLEESKRAVEAVSAVFELAAVLVIVIGAMVTAKVAWSHQRVRDGRVYYAVRATFGRSVLLGLEVLVAGDIIRTVAVAPTLADLAVLASLVGIRTFLSWALEVEIDGRWPWRRAEDEAAAEARAAPESGSG